MADLWGVGVQFAQTGLSKKSPASGRRWAREIFLIGLIPVTWRKTDIDIFGSVLT